MINEKRILNLFLDLVKIDSPSLKEKDVAVFLQKLMEKKGLEVKEDLAGEACGGNTGNLIVRIPATGEGEPIAFSAHMDCVSPCIGVVPVVDEKIVRSAGNTVLGGDDKAGIAMMIEALAHLEEESIPHPEIYFIFSICEESGMHGAKNMDDSLLPAKEVVVLDSGGSVGTIVVEAPAKAGIQMTFIGKSAHAGIVPEDGISAIQLAAEAVSDMNLLRINDHTTANLGRIEGGQQLTLLPTRSLFQPKPVLHKMNPLPFSFSIWKNVAVTQLQRLAETMSSNMKFLILHCMWIPKVRFYKKLKVVVRI